MRTESSSEGARLLLEAMTARGIGRTEAAALLGCDRSMVRRWLNCERTPDINHASNIESVFGIPCSSWATAAIRKSA